MDQNLISKKPFLYFPIAMFFIFYFISFFMTSTSNIDPEQIVSLEEILSFQSDYSTFFVVFLLISLADFFILHTFVQKTLSKPSIFMVTLSITELPLILGFVMSHLTFNLTMFLPFTFIFLIYYGYAYTKLLPIFHK